MVGGERILVWRFVISAAFVIIFFYFNKLLKVQIFEFTCWFVFPFLMLWFELLVSESLAEWMLPSLTKEFLVSYYFLTFFLCIDGTQDLPKYYP